MSGIDMGGLEPNREEFELPEVVENLLFMIEPQAVSLKHELDVFVTDVRHERLIGDAPRLRRILAELLGGAVKYAPYGGSISFSVTECPAAADNAARFEFTVEFDGAGMPEELLPRDFARLMGGDIRAESKRGNGSRFTLTLCFEFIQPEDEEFQLNGGSVLIISSHRNACHSVCDMLRGLGADCVWLASAEEAAGNIRSMTEIGKPYSVILFDRMSVGSDCENIRAVRETVPREKSLIAVAVHKECGLIPEMRGAGAEAFIEKPLFRTRLISLFRELGLAADNPQQQRSLQGKRILIADDNVINLFIVSELVSATGAAAQTAGDGRAACDILLSSEPNSYDMVLMDIVMPVMTGYEAAKLLRSCGREDLAEIPIAAMTANTCAEDIREALASGMNDYISKPIDRQKLNEVLFRLIK